MSEKWTDQLPTLMEGYEEAAPEGLWDAVQAGVGAGAPAPGSAASDRRRFAVAWWTAGSLAAAAAVVLAVFLWKPAQPELSVVPGEELAETIQVVENVPEVVPEVISESAGKAIRQVQKTERQETSAPVQDQPETHPEETRAPETTPPVQDKAAPQGTTTWAPVPDSNKPGSTRKKTPRRVEVVLSTGGYLAQANGGTVQGYGVPYNPGMPATKAHEGDTKAEGLTVPMLSRNRESTTESTHRQSVRLSLGVSYSFAPRWSVGTGVTYNVLRSDYSTESGTTVTNTTRHLHYLGIPLNLQFNFLEWRMLSLSLNAGGLWEAAVGSKLNTRSYVGEQLASSFQEFPQVKDFRWSVNAGVGVQYQLFRYGALFLQPGVIWHLPGNGEVESYYTVHPVSFDLTFGYRFTF